MNQTPPRPAPAGRRRRALAVALLLVATGCAPRDWSSSQKSDAFRMCRGPAAPAKVNVLQEDAQALTSFMCECQVEHLSSSVSHAKLLSAFHLEEVNFVLSGARADCLKRWRRNHGTGQ